MKSSENRPKYSIAPPDLTPDQAANIAVAGIFNIRDRKLAQKLRRQGRTKEAEAAERRIELRRKSLQAEK